MMIAVDVGGTFTDVVALQDGQIRVAKVSTNYTDVTRPVLEGAAMIGTAGSRVFNHARTSHRCQTDGLPSWTGIGKSAA